MANILWTQNKFLTVEQIVDITDNISDGTAITKKNSIDDDDYEKVKDFAIPSAVPNNIIKNRYKKVVSNPVDRVRKVDLIGKQYLTALDLNTSGTGIQRTQFIANVLRSVNMWDFTYLVMDDVAASYKTGNKDADIENRAFPFFTIVKPYQVNEDYTFYDSNDNLTQFAWDYDFVGEEGEESTRTKIISKTEIKILDGGSEDADLTVAIDTSMYKNQLPVKIIRGDETAPNSQLLDTTPSIYACCKSVINIMTLDAGLDFALDNGSYAQFVYACSDARRKAILNSTEEFRLDGSGVIFEDKDQSNISRFMTPTIGNYEAISSRKQQKFEQIYREEGMKFAQGGSAQSGDSKLMDQTENNSNLQFMSRIATDVDIWIDTVFSAYLGFNYEQKESTYGYPEDFGLKDIEGQIDNLTQFLEQGGANIPIAKKETLKQTAAALFQGAALENVVKAIDAEDFSEADSIEVTE